MSNKSQYKYVRNVKGGWQARVWDGRFRDHINLGVYQEERMAWHVVREYVHHGVYPDHLSPKYVRTHGSLYNACIKTKRFQIRVGPYLYPEIAQDMLFRRLQKRYPTVWRLIRLRAETQDRPPVELAEVLFPAGMSAGYVPLKPKEPKMRKRRGRIKCRRNNSEQLNFPEIPATFENTERDTGILDFA